MISGTVILTVGGEKKWSAKQQEEEAKRSCAKANANGTLKPLGALDAATAYIDWETRTTSASETTWLDYVATARP